MLSIEKGRIGELAVAKDLLQQGYDIYRPVVDSNHVDFIVELQNGQMKRVNVKCVTQQRGTAARVKLSKHRHVNRVDIVAIYFMPKEIIAYVPYEDNHEIVLALATGKNNQEKGRKWFYSYERFPEFS